MAVVGITAAMYVALTLSLYMISYGDIQFRIAEVLNLLPFINPVFAPGIILGCLLANIGSPLGAIDMVVGTLQTALVMVLITRTKKLWLACLWPVLGGLIIAGMLVYVLVDIPSTFAGYALTSATVMFGQAVVMFGLGFPLFKFGILKNEKLIKFLKSL